MEEKKVDLPDKIICNEFPDRIEIIKQWFGTEGIFMVIMAMGAAYYIYQEYDAILFATSMQEIYLNILLFSLSALWVYYLLAQLLNRTCIKLDHRLIVVKHGPLPWPGNIIWPVADLDKIYVETKIEDEQRHEYGATDQGEFRRYHNTDSNVEYDINATTNSGRNIRLLSCGENPKEALFLEGKIDEYLQSLKNR